MALNIGRLFGRGQQDKFEAGSGELMTETATVMDAGAVDAASQHNQTDLEFVRGVAMKAGSDNVTLENYSSVPGGTAAPTGILHEDTWDSQGLMAGPGDGAASAFRRNPAGDGTTEGYTATDDLWKVRGESLGGGESARSMQPGEQGQGFMMENGELMRTGYTATDDLIKTGGQYPNAVSEVPGGEQGQGFMMENGELMRTGYTATDDLTSVRGIGGGDTGVHELPLDAGAQQFTIEKWELFGQGQFTGSEEQTRALLNHMQQQGIFDVSTGEILWAQGAAPEANGLSEAQQQLDWIAALKLETGPGGAVLMNGEPLSQGWFVPDMDSDQSGMAVGQGGGGETARSAGPDQFFRPNPTGDGTTQQFQSQTQPHADGYTATDDLWKVRGEFGDQPGLNGSDMTIVGGAGGAGSLANPQVWSDTDKAPTGGDSPPDGETARSMQPGGEHGQGFMMENGELMRTGLTATDAGSQGGATPVDGSSSLATGRRQYEPAVEAGASREGAADAASHGAGDDVLHPSIRSTDLAPAPGAGQDAGGPSSAFEDVHVDREVDKASPKFNDGETQPAQALEGGPGQGGGGDSSTSRTQGPGSGPDEPGSSSLDLRPDDARYLGERPRIRPEGEEYKGDPDDIASAESQRPDDAVPVDLDGDKEGQAWYAKFDGVRRPGADDEGPSTLLGALQVNNGDAAPTDQFSINFDGVIARDDAGLDDRAERASNFSTGNEDAPTLGQSASVPDRETPALRFEPIQHTTAEGAGLGDDGFMDYADDSVTDGVD